MQYLSLLVEIAVVWAIVGLAVYWLLKRLPKDRQRSFRWRPRYKPRERLGLPRIDFTAKVAHVIDGDTVDVVSQEGRLFRVRLDSIDCPEDGQHWGDTATAGLIKLIGGKTVYLENHGVDPYDRILATIYVTPKNGTERVNVNERMVVLGHAWVYRQFYNHLPQQRRDSLNRMENWARTRQVGLWRTPDPIPPWEWRASSETKASPSPWYFPRKRRRRGRSAAAPAYRVPYRRSPNRPRRSADPNILWPVLAVGAVLVGLVWLYDSGILYRAGITSRAPSGGFVRNKPDASPSDSFSGRVTYVIDGDTFTLDSRRKHIRLWGIDAPEAGSQAGTEATAALRRTIHGQSLSCQSRAIDKYGRIVAQCALADGGDVSEKMLAMGKAERKCWSPRGRSGGC